MFVIFDESPFEKFLTLKKGIICTLFVFATLFLYQVAFAVTNPEQEGPEEDPKQEELEEPLQESDSTESQPVSLFSGDELLEITEQGADSENIPESDNFYEADEEDNSQSVISFNFLYYLLQKFKFSESLLY